MGSASTAQPITFMEIKVKKPAAIAAGTEPAAIVTAAAEAEATCSVAQCLILHAIL